VFHQVRPQVEYAPSGILFSVNRHTLLWLGKFVEDRFENRGCAITDLACFAARRAISVVGIAVLLALGDLVDDEHGGNPCNDRVDKLGSLGWPVGSPDCPKFTSVAAITAEINAVLSRHWCLPLHMDATAHRRGFAHSNLDVESLALIVQGQIKYHKAFVPAKHNSQ
jgi:hypothetical protein